MDNKTICRELYRAINENNLGRFDELVAENFVENEEMPGTAPGREGLHQFFEMLRGAFPDLSFAVDDIVAEGDRVCIRATVTGTQRGEFMGVPASGKSVKVPVADFMRLEGGRIVEHWGVTDMGALMDQNG